MQCMLTLLSASTVCSWCEWELRHWPDLSGSLRTLYIRCNDWNLALASCTCCKGQKA